MKKPVDPTFELVGDQIKASIDGWREKENNENPID